MGGGIKGPSLPFCFIISLSKEERRGEEEEKKRRGEEEEERRGEEEKRSLLKPLERRGVCSSLKRPPLESQRGRL